MIASLNVQNIRQRNLHIPFFVCFRSWLFVHASMEYQMDPRSCKTNSSMITHIVGMRLILENLVAIT